MSGLGALAGSQPLLFVAVGAIVLAAGGWMLERERPELARNLRRLGYLGLIAALLLQVGVLALQAERSDAALELNSRPALSVSGRETIVPLASDGHFWIEAEVNGQPIAFLVDTGATFTGVGRGDAAALGIRPDPGRAPLELQTANGMITARLGRIDSLRFGNIEVRGLEVAVPQETDDEIRVIGMNLLSRLGSWRVEGDRLILVPR
ncbi:TIGR02281 family clan AA aspartic protease [Novosphingobium sp.]|uniref:retropepsin-like aspartic protease family protein n=1 Tax=Novosphingobium sp. TaxID=1874826 RepID=UPI0022C06383|nr:TIGR02281 family clan AA aspartic protease [Novosphingobium sp.]MCZ8019627.1 TIGR02281 family clan AA aspartic protease [Novosphingobium sp.]MCZ8035442.1 TIGR02281 family clan AA aspartic protease [Novosphingobium sp.]MCZ8050756.1 TIGR02281 family clan AA aspartic protease [Novosphingobium sp.]MCZ8059102.1 TIGR02281 family clan AA aspartic protease [Novosphingobium sp.]MCZ8232548.1 TIGR02281 family clan AA aspartic protease [Novosphingobium sp.]